EITVTGQPTRWQRSEEACQDSLFPVGWAKMVEADQPGGEAHGGCCGVGGARPRQDDHSEGGGRLDRRPAYRRGEQEGAEGATQAGVPTGVTGAAVRRGGRVGPGVV